jgi:hypothetical protein
MIAVVMVNAVQQTQHAFVILVMQVKTVQLASVLVIVRGTVHVWQSHNYIVSVTLVMLVWIAMLKYVQMIVQGMAIVLLTEIVLVYQVTVGTTVLLEHAQMVVMNMVFALIQDVNAMLAIKVLHVKKDYVV